jgi:Tfp pilus assembly protein PilZ
LGEKKLVAVTFASGRDVLNAYWGFLSNGGLVIRDPQGLREGDQVTLDVSIESVQQSYRLSGHVVRRPPDAPSPDHAVIAFDPGEPHDLLLSAAWADTDKVPARKHRRVPAHAQIRLAWPRFAEGSMIDLAKDAIAESADGRLVNLSRGGCCIRVRATVAPSVGAGDRVAVVIDGIEVAGAVRWAQSADFGVEFDPADARVDELIRKYL